MFEGERSPKIGYFKKIEVKFIKKRAKSMILSAVLFGLVQIQNLNVEEKGLDQSRTLNLH